MILNMFDLTISDRLTPNDGDDGASCSWSKTFRILYETATVKSFETGSVNGMLGNKARAQTHVGGFVFV